MLWMHFLNWGFLFARDSLVAGWYEPNQHRPLLPYPQQNILQKAELFVSGLGTCMLKKGHTEKQNFQWYSMEGLTIYWETSWVYCPIIHTVHKFGGLWYILGICWIIKVSFFNKKQPSLLISINIIDKNVIKMAQYFFFHYKWNSKGRREKTIHSAKPVLNTGN